MQAEEAMRMWKKELEKKHNNGKEFFPGPAGRGGWTTWKVLPPHLWYLNLYSDFREGICKYFCENGIEFHEQIGNLLSSQAFCLNMFWGARMQPAIMEGIVKRVRGADNKSAMNTVEFEWNDYDIAYRQFGETTGRRGFKQTSADIAVFYTLDGNDALLLIEFKFTEGMGKYPNAFGKCHFSESCQNMERRDLLRNSGLCPLEKNERKPQHYWNLIKESDGGPFTDEFLNRAEPCPFRFDGYQLMRNQLLGWLYCKREGLRHDFLVLYDERNPRFIKPIKVAPGRLLGLADWSKFVKDDCFHYLSIQEAWGTTGNSSSPSHKKYIDNRYFSFE